MQFGRIRNGSDTSNTNATARLTTAIQSDRVDLLYCGTFASLTTSFAIAVLLVSLHRTQHAMAGDLAWLGVISGLLLGRLIAGWLYRVRRGLLSDSAAWLRLFRNGASLTAGAWGVAGILFLPEQQPLLQAMTLIMLAGIAAAALSAMAADFPTYRNYVVLTLSPLVAINLLRGSNEERLVGIMALVLMLFLLRSGRATAAAIASALTLHHENAALVDDLRSEKDRVLSDAEAMMGTVLSASPIILWAVDNDGVITFIEGRQFAAQTGHDLPEVGDNLFDAFATQPQIAYETQRALSGEAFAAEVELDGHSYEIHYNPMRDDAGSQQGAIGVAIDITDRVAHKQELSRRAHYDELTGLPNRTLIMSQIEHAFDNARRHSARVGLFFIDLDNFKSVNDTMGHNAGDELLRLAAERLNDAVRQNDMPARLGGDEFLVVSEDLHRPEDAEVIAHKIARVFQRPFVVEQREVYATTSVGIAIFPEDGTTAESLLQSADTAMYHAKTAGKNKYRFFTRQMQDTAERHLAMETDLRKALARDELRLMYQPKYDARSGRLRGAEALLRWDSPRLGQVSPDDFIPVAEVAGLMPQIGDWILRTACTEAATWQAISDTPLHVAVNVSPQQFRNTDLLANVTQALVATAMKPGLLELEITESVLVEDAPETMAVFTTLCDMGITLALDDFGTGYSSLSYLKKFPMRVLKIDKAFVQDLDSDDDNASLVEAIIAMAHSLHMDVVAEGVETEEQYAFLKQRDVELVQGFLFCRPVSADAFRALIRDEADGREPRPHAV